MTTSCYPVSACAEGSQVRGDNAWIVNFNNGNSNINHRDNNNRVRAVRGPAREFQGAGQAQQVTLRELHAAWKAARRQKVPSANQLDFDTNWADRLLDLQEQINAGTWLPRPTTCFVATRPKAREIHAPDFGDRVVHHWLIPQLEAVYERTFIADSFANRRGKGSHAAVRKLQCFVREVHSGQGGGYFLQLDIANFFNRIHRPTLYRLLKTRMERVGLPLVARKAAHALLRRSPLEVGVHHVGAPADRALVPPHKRLENAPAGCGIPIGNLSSQFFANVYLDRLDQFVKHTLKVKRYLRYVDDFVLVHHDRAQLTEWKARIIQFLADELRLALKEDAEPRPLGDGIDFLGYVVRPTHTTVRRRVVSHARAALAAWETAHVANGKVIGTPDDLRAVRAVWASYEGHLRHANSYRLQASLHRRFPWLATAARPRRFSLRLEGQQITIPVKKGTVS
jgi:hypothetical protein